MLLLWRNWKRSKNLNQMGKSWLRKFLIIIFFVRLWLSNNKSLMFAKDKYQRVFELLILSGKIKVSFILCYNTSQKKESTTSNSTVPTQWRLYSPEIFQFLQILIYTLICHDVLLAIIDKLLLCSYCSIMMNGCIPL